MSWGLFLVCWAVAAAVAIALGRDANWDIRNYHVYNSYALLEGRWAVDLAPAGLHSFLHPGLDIPFYLLVQGPLNAWPRVVSTLQAGSLGLLAFLTLAVVNLVCHGDARRATGESILVAAFGLTGAATLPQAGATFNDVPVACLVIGAVLMLLLVAQREALSERTEQSEQRAQRFRFLAGVLGGAAVGLKLTAAIYPPALAAVALLGARGSARRLQALTLLAAGGALGFAVSFGPWGWFLYERFGNPFGPYLNDIFRSPWFPPTSQADSRFLPDGLGQALVYPLFWARPSVWIVTEETVADPRFALSLTAALLTAGAAGYRRFRRGREQESHRTGTSDFRDQSIRMVLAFICIAYAAWLGAFAVLRYAVAIEVLLGITVWAAARALLGLSRAGAVPHTVRRGAALCIGTSLFLCALTTTYPDWPRQPFAWEREPRGTAAVGVSPITLPEGSLVVMLWGAVSFVAPYLDGPGIRFVTAAHPVWAGSDLYRYGREVRQIVRSHPGPGFALLEDSKDYNRELARTLTIEIDPAFCQPVANNLTRQVEICRWR